MQFLWQTHEAQSTRLAIEKIPCEPRVARGSLENMMGHIIALKPQLPAACSQDAISRQRAIYQSSNGIRVDNVVLKGDQIPAWLYRARVRCPPSEIA